MYVKPGHACIKTFRDVYKGGTIKTNEKEQCRCDEYCLIGIH